MLECIYTRTNTLQRSLLDLSKNVGADELVYLDSDNLPKEPVYDILYDTTGSVDGFALALKLTNRSKSGSTLC